MIRTYILVDHQPVPEPDFDTWTQWCGQHLACHVALTQVGPYLVSTIFLAMDHTNRTPPLLFETMIFDLPKDEPYQQRCATWDQALAQHADAVAWLQERVT